jgi:hypothetical protein
LTAPLELGERVLGLLSETATSSTYKPALLLALLDRTPEHLEDGRVPVRALAERVVELFWPQTLDFPTGSGGVVLLQNQAGGQAAIVRDVADFRTASGSSLRTLPEALRRGGEWQRLLDRVETTLAEWPIPRLQRPYPEPVLYRFDWPWAEEGRWSLRAYRASSRSVALLPGVAAGLVSLGPLLRPFVTRWWSEKAARLNPGVEAARALVEFEDFLFGRDRVALARVAEGLLDLQAARCFYCARRVARDREVDHVVPWSHSGDDGLDNLVVACRPCNNHKRANLPAARHIAALVQRRAAYEVDLEHLADERRWPRAPRRTLAAQYSAYLRLPEAGWTWTADAATGLRRIVSARAERQPALDMLRAVS